MKALDKLNKEVTQEILKIINTKKGGKRNRPAKRDTGKLKKIKSIVDFDGNNFSFDLSAIEYYKYLDQGTDKIKKPWFYTEEIIKSERINKLMNDFLANYFIEEIEKQWQ